MNEGEMTRVHERPGIGGGAASLSAALALSRVRRSVLVVNAGDLRTTLAAGVGAEAVQRVRA